MIHYLKPLKIEKRTGSKNSNKGAIDLNVLDTFLERDISIVKELHKTRYMTIEMIKDLFWPDSKTIRTAQIRMKKLTELQLVRSFPIPTNSTGRKPLIYAPGKLGAFILNRDYAIPQKSVNYLPNNREQNGGWLQHYLSGVGAYIIVKTACAHNPNIDLTLWEYESAFLTKNSYDRVEIEYKGKKQKMGVQPDSHFILKIQSHNHQNQPVTRQPHLFPEYDFANVTHEPSTDESLSMVKKMLARQAWFNDKCSTITKEGKTRAVSLFEKRYQVSAARILWITTGEVRMQAMINTAENMDVPNKHYNWFTTFDLFTPENILTGKIWRVATKEGLYSLTW